jgi:hypothetical protein
VVGVDVLTTAQAARVAGIDERNAPAMVPRLVGTLAHRHVENRDEWSAGEVLAIAVVRALDPHGTNPGQWAEGATRVGAAHERGLCPAYLVTAGGADFGIVLDDEAGERTTVELLGKLVRRRGLARVVPIAPIVEHLCDVLELRASA